jgi:hypothetical protein
MKGSATGVVMNDLIRSYRLCTWHNFMNSERYIPDTGYCWYPAKPSPLIITLIPIPPYHFEFDSHERKSNYYIRLYYNFCMFEDDVKTVIITLDKVRVNNVTVSTNS